MRGLERLCKSIVASNHAALDGHVPSVYEYLGVAQYNLGRLQDATESFKKAVALHPNHGEVYMHLGDCYLSQFLVDDAIRVFEVALVEKKIKDDLSVLFKARNWVANWTDHELVQDTVAASTASNLIHGRTPLVSAADLGNLPGNVILQVSQRALHSQPSTVTFCCSPDDPHLQASSPKLKIGFVSSDFGVHPVATLLRGLMAMLPSPHFEVYCFALTDAPSWWRTNITAEVDHMISLHGVNHQEAASAIYSHGIHVLVDLNGHTLHSGLPIFSHRPAPVQMTFLGYPLTTGSSFIDYFIVDPVSASPLHVHDSFSEKMIYLPHNYIVNDHKQMMRHVAHNDTRRPTRSQANLAGLARSAFVFATFSNWQKMDPTIFATWMHILQRVPHGVVWFQQYSGYATAKKNLVQQAKQFGIDGASRFVFTPLTPWINHTWVKQAADLVLDTALKNGHTTIVDALWAGVPIVTLQGDRMSNRAASSAVASMDDDRLNVMTTNSIKEYEDVAVHLALRPHLLKSLRRTLESQRAQSYPSSPHAKSTGHVRVILEEVPSEPSPHKVHHPNASAPPPLLLHIGGHVRTNLENVYRQGWTVVNIQPLPHVDLVREMKHLHGIADSSVSAIYSSHALEHCGYGAHAADVEATLAEWFRVLKPGGALFVSVPDLSVLATLFVDPTLTPHERFHVMRMIYGGQVDAHDFHKVGFNKDILNSFLAQAGFCNVTTVRSFGLFQDTSDLVFHNKSISLNVIAKACKPGDDVVSVNLPSPTAT
ncbi:hypothetical protein AaE_007183, partial [Aphanomyces astaci]